MLFMKSENHSQLITDGTAVLAGGRSSRPLNVGICLTKNEACFFLSAHPTGSAESISGSVWLCVSVRHHFEDDHWSWSLFLLIGFTDPYNHTSSESLWWKLFKNHKRTQIQRQTQWQRQLQRQIYRKSASKTQHVLYFWNPDDFLIPFQIWW